MEFKQLFQSVGQIIRIGKPFEGAELAVFCAEIADGEMFRRLFRR
ncbi:MAG TPA: hypothetical protein VM553_11325 [Dongiaceae bacterium]|nr:hypothetical protein [Dongiaceae bacterium]